MDALALLRLQIEWGADEALEDDPVDRLRPAATRPPATAPPSPALPSAPTRRTPPSLPPTLQGTPAERAAAVAAQADTIETLRAAVAAFDGCALRDTASHLVFATGTPETGILLVGDPPGSDEDRSGTPFAGTHGTLLDKMLASIGFDRSALLLAPLIPWRPPGGRPPTPSELAICLPFLHRLITLAETRHMLIFGTLAARTLLGAQPRRKASVQWQECTIPGLSRPVQAIMAPSLQLLMKTPSLRRDAWKALRVLRRAAS